MVTQNARVHGTHVSNRAKAKEVLEKKAILKSVLDNPLKVKCPSIPLNLQNVILSRLIDLLEKRPPFRNYSKPNRHAPVKGSPASALPQPNEAAARDSLPASEHGPSIDGPQRNVVVGINAVTRALERELDSFQQQQDGVLSTDTVELSNRTLPRLTISAVFVCRQDLNPPALIEHIPHLAAACNAAKMGPTGKTYQPLKLIQLPAGAEHSLASVLRLRRVAALALHSDTPELATLSELLDSVPVVQASWISRCSLTARTDATLTITHIKQTQTTAPKDMRLAKEQRFKGRASAKVSRRASLQKRGRNLAKQNVVLDTAYSD